MEQISLSIKGLEKFISRREIDEYAKLTAKYNKNLHEKTGAGNDFLGWVDLPNEISNKQEIIDAATNISKEIDVMVVIGIGGSYLGAKAVIDALSDNFSNYDTNSGSTRIVYAGHNISEDYLVELLQFLKLKEWGITVISKSGTTTEPAIAFRVLKNELETRYGKKLAGKRIIAITDEKKGALRQLADAEDYKTFVIPDDVGGRYSVLTPVGLFPIAVAGFDINEIIRGALYMHERTSSKINYENNIAEQYAAVRNALYKKGKTTEILVNYNPKLHYISEWWKQLYGESEGKENKGIFPASVNFTTDLHSMGQYIQEGIRNIFETVISVKAPENKLVVPHDELNLDKLNYLEGKRFEDINKMAELGTSIAHIDGGVPNIKIEIPKINEFYIGQLIYFFEKACGISGYALGVNPFDQPGVEAYKKNMFALLEKPGFEKETAEIKKRQND
ncbi:MAG: glucose-6-phosphate isomerase [Bacteroidetes bacterium]|nr:MAG: glucose-6-phosphate isomerase [Bacteroidota bacterium]